MSRRSWFTKYNLYLSLPFLPKQLIKQNVKYSQQYSSTSQYSVALIKLIRNKLSDDWSQRDAGARARPGVGNFLNQSWEQLGGRGL